MSIKMLEACNVSKIVRGRKLIDRVSFEVYQGDICGFLGPNGAGKTTMIRLLTGLISPTAGELRVNGIDVHQHRSKALLELGAIVESPIFFPYMTGRKNLLNLARLHPNLPAGERKRRVEKVLQTVGLTEAADQKVKTYSLGMKQRLGIAQALLGNPKGVILDEPANGLDPMGMRELRELIIRLRDQQGLTFFISSHLLDELEQMCNRLVVIQKGRLIWQGKMEELSRSDVWLYTVRQADRALADLSGKVTVKKLSPTKLEIQVGEEEIGEINKLLMQHNVQVLGIEKKQKKLEDIFIELVSS